LKLKQKRIRKTTKLLSDIKRGEKFILGILINEEVEKKLIEIMNIPKIKTSLSIFPKPFLGIMSKRNSIGEYVPEKDKPKEIAYRPQEWTLKDWGGNEHTGTEYVQYTRYPRKFVEPKEFKFIITETQSKEKILQINKVFKNTEEENKDIVFATNLMLEIIGSVDTFNLDGDNNIIEVDDIKTVNWEILPPGERIWDSFEKKQRNLLSKSEKTLMKERFDFIEKFNPDLKIKGIGGYIDYIIFGFKNKNIYIFDSIIYGDATYIFENDWEKVSKLTKKEIITQGLAKDRIIHNRLWETKIRKYLEE
jgi:hypothetical protein